MKVLRSKLYVNYRSIIVWTIQKLHTKLGLYEDMPAEVKDKEEEEEDGKLQNGKCVSHWVCC